MTGTYTSTDGLALIDRATHPIDDLEGPAGRAFVEQAQASLAATGCVVVRGLLTDEAVARISREASELAPCAHFNRGRANPYGGAADAALPSSHPRNRMLERYNGFVAGDWIEPHTALRRLYHDRSFQKFIGACVGVEPLYEYADPLAGLVINVLPPKAEHAWHFDTNEFVVTILTQKPDAGGLFEYCPGIRSAHDENLDAVAGVLDGERRYVRTLDLNPGDLQIFFGRFSLHRVTPVEGQRDRHTVILGYAQEGNMIGSAEKTRRLFGRIADVHRQDRPCITAT